MTSAFDVESTEGYSEEEISALNAEWTARAVDLGLEESTDNYKEEMKVFQDEVSRR